MIERCKLPKDIELRKKLGYNQDNIMVYEETSTAEKIIKSFPHENLILENQIFGLKHVMPLLRLMKVNIRL